MIDMLLATHYIIIFIIAMVSIFANGVGGYKASCAALDAIHLQPGARAEIIRAAIIGLALIETAVILALIIIFFLFMQAHESISLAHIIAEIGSLIATSIPAALVGICSAYPIAKAMHAISRQPFFAQPIINLMLITQVIQQTAIIFGFLVSLFIQLQINTLTSLIQAAAFCASGIAIGIGCVGPLLGLTQFAKTCCTQIGTNRNAYQPLLSFIFVSGAIIETPLILAFLISLTLLLSSFSYASQLIFAIKAFAAALCIGIGTAIPGMSSGKTAATAAQEISNDPSIAAEISQTSLFAQGIIDASAIYALVVALIIIFL